jgi:hypothetical protein
MSRSLDEIYCAGLRKCGANGFWEPDRWLAPGDYGYFRSGAVLKRERALSELGFQYDTVVDLPSFTDLHNTSISASHGTADAAVADPIGYVLSTKAQVSYDVTNGAEVVVLMGVGRWWSLQSSQDLLGQIRDSIANWPVGRILVASVFVTYGGVATVSSRSISGFTLGLDAKGAPHLVVRAGATTLLGRFLARAATRTFTLWQGDADHEIGADITAEPTRGKVYTPLFGDTFRVRARWFGHFGRKELVTQDGRPAYDVIARTAPEDQLYNESQATMSLDDIRALSIDDLFERVTPEIIDQDLADESHGRAPTGLEPA